MIGQSNSMYFYGEYGPDVLRTGNQLSGGRREKIEVLPVPKRLKDEVAAVGDFVQNRRCALARDFVADIQEKAYCNYLTFRVASVYQAAIEAVRGDQGWTELPL